MARPVESRAPSQTRWIVDETYRYRGVTVAAITIPDEVIEALGAFIANRIGSGADDPDARAGSGSPWLTAREAAEYLRCPVGRLYKNPNLPRHHEGRRVLFHREELDRYVKGLG